MSDLAVRCEGLTKSFALGELSIQHSLRVALRQAEPPTPFEALHDVSFSIPRGSFFGIIGHNGSGKSTLTQIISGISVPTAGRVHVWGRILPLLEVGAGFHDELTGSENVVLLGTILGVSPTEIAAQVPRIVRFAGIEQHMDTAVKRYSSGMRARLSFATAICLPADTYVFDEVLAVVDDDFRARCVEAMRGLNAAGRTVVLMSHDLNLIRESCDQGVWLDHGRVRMTGVIDELSDAYAAHMRGLALESA